MGDEFCNPENQTNFSHKRAVNIRLQTTNDAMTSPGGATLW
jgi:hypothetical protein